MNIIIIIIMIIISMILITKQIRKQRPKGSKVRSKHLPCRQESANNGAKPERPRPAAQSVKKITFPLERQKSQGI